LASATGVALAVALPAAAIDDVGGDPGQVPSTLGQDVGLRGTHGVVAGTRFRAASNVLRRGRAGALATAAFQAASAQGPEAVLATFIDRVNQESDAAGQGPGGGGGTDGRGLLALAAIGGGAFGGGGGLLPGLMLGSMLGGGWGGGDW
jgi:hypothetical protein